MDILKALWDLMNGHKLNTGTLMILAVFILGRMGFDHDAATQMCTNILCGIGGVTALVGFIHQVIKKWQAKKDTKKK